jgi:peptidase M28-like protein/PA domain-containing protein
MRRTIVLFAAAMMCAASLTAQEKAPSNDTIHKEDLRADLFFLAGDEMRGRLTDTPENRLAAEWIRSRFERLGLKPAAGNSYFQNYNLMTATLGVENSLKVREASAELTRSMGQDFYPQTFSSSGRARGSVVFAGFGITAPHLNHDDYRNSDVRGKIALILDHEPGERDPQSVFDGLASSEASAGWRKAVYAQNAGAMALLIVSDVHNHPGERNFETAARNAWPTEPPRIRRFTLQDWADRVRIPVVQISPALAEILVRGTNKSLEELAKSAETRGGVTGVALPGADVEVAISVERHTIGDRNVVAYLEGSDPKLKDEWVIVCAHYDHDGADGTRIFNGADDNGSGTVGLLEIAEAFAEAARAGKRPRRSVLFAAWNSEERGLLGAWAYTESPLRPLEKTAVVLNMDMIGRNEEVPEGGGNRFRGMAVQTGESNKNAVELSGYTWSASLLAEVKKANAAVGLDILTRYDNHISNLVRRSDQWPFLNHGVPGFCFNTGLHPDYHTQYDRPEKINYDKMERVARLVHQTAWNLANQDARPTLDRKTIQ